MQRVVPFLLASAVVLFAVAVVLYLNGLTLPALAVMSAAIADGAIALWFRSRTGH